MMDETSGCSFLESEIGNGSIVGSGQMINVTDSEIYGDLPFDEDWDDTVKDGIGIDPLQSDTDLDVLDIPSPTFPCVNSSNVASDLQSINQRGQDVQDSLAVAGMVGLCNLGNTCFMNSGLQCLLSNDRLIKFFVEDFGEDESAQNTLTGYFARLVHKFWLGRYTLLYPSDFKNSVGIYHPQFSDRRQHDCQEFLALLLDSLHEYLNNQNAAKMCAISVSGQSALLSSQKVDQPTFENLQLDSDHSLPGCSPVPVDMVDKESQNNVLLVTKKLHVCEPLELSNNVTYDYSATDQASIKAENVQMEELASLSSDPDVGYLSDERMDADPENVHRKIPSIDDFCSKDTKTLNTNVLVSTDEPSEMLATDSVKFQKLDNTSVITSEVDIADEVTEAGVLTGDPLQLHELLIAAACTSKPLKETNLVANCFDKFANENKLLLTDAMWEQSSMTLSDMQCFGVDGIKRFFNGDSSKLLDLPSSVAGFEKRGEDSIESPGDINNIKRIKIDDQAAEKNLRMQNKLKVNTEQNQTRNSGLLVNNPCQASGCGDQLSLSPSSSSHSSFGAVSDDIGLLQPEAGSAAAFCGTVEGLLQQEYARNAERAWQAYTMHNQSVIVSTFQGQFKSTVVCSECRHVSVTFEPFMYLSVPLPHAMERQISVIFVPCDSKQPVRYLVTVHRMSTVKQLRAELITMIGEEESCDLVIAEVLDHHVARILEDTMQIKIVNDADRTIYAFEMLPPPPIEILPEGLDSDGNSGRLEAIDSVANNSATSVSSLPTSDSINEIVWKLVSESQPAKPDVESLLSGVLNNSIESATPVGSESMVSQLESNPDVDWQHNVLDDRLLHSVIDSRDDCGGIGLLQNLHSCSDSQKASLGGWNIELEGNDTQCNACPDNGGVVFSSDRLEDYMSSDSQIPRKAEPGGVTVANNDTDDAHPEETIADQWKSCVICLEDMADSELMAHASCGGTLCQTCLEMSTKHLGSPFAKCPVCSHPVTSDDDFIPLSCMANYKPKTRILSVPVVCRYIYVDPSTTSKESLILFGHPTVLYLPSKLTGSLLYETVDRIVPLLASYSIVLTNGQGLRCSRCLYPQHCTGCEILRDAPEISLLPGDHLAVQFGNLERNQTEAASQFSDHQSMAALRPDNAMTLYDCFRAFTDSELLDEHNPWFCPRCRKNQCASKTMSVWRYPDTLIVYLKRFVYHELSSTKIDNKVVFPVENLDLSGYLTGPRTSNLVYDLQSCVLHFGGVNSGHYTAYVRHPVSNEWLYTNDETVIKQKPSESDCSHVYVLFYQQRGTQVGFSVPLPVGSEESADEDDTSYKAGKRTAVVSSSAPHFSPSNSIDDPALLASGSESTHSFDFYS